MAVVDNTLLLLPSPERISELPQSSNQELSLAFFGDYAHLPSNWVEAMLARSLADNEGIVDSSSVEMFVDAPTVPEKEEARILSQPDVLAAFEQSVDKFEAWEQSL